MFSFQLRDCVLQAGENRLATEGRSCLMKRSIAVILIILSFAASALAQERIKFPVGVSSKVLGYGHLWAAWRRGYFEGEGLDVEVVLMRGTAPAVQALIAGSISAALLANDGPITAVEQGADLVMVASGS